jgi:hypothetical protein
VSDPTADVPASWTSAGYVARWSRADALGELLALPRRMAAALVADARIDVGGIVDLGAGAGAFLADMLDAFPSADGLWVDSSSPMLERGRAALARFGDRVRFELLDVRDVGSLPLDGADVVVSSRVIHHFTPETIRALYAETLAALPPGGFLFNLDHFRASGDWDAALRRVRPGFLPPRGDHERHGHDAPPRSLEEHLGWLRDLGFETPDAPWRFFYTALVVARAPSEVRVSPEEPTRGRTPPTDPRPR